MLTDRQKEFLKDIKKKVVIKLDTLEEYEKKLKKSDEYLERCKELAEEYYDLMNEFYDVYDDFETVWGVQPMDEKYIKSQGMYRRLFKTKNVLFNQLYYGIRKNNKNEKMDAPEGIECLEYILVPTGNIEIYKDGEYNVYKEKRKKIRDTWQRKVKERVESEY